MDVSRGPELMERKIMKLVGVAAHLSSCENAKKLLNTLFLSSCKYSNDSSTWENTATQQQSDLASYRCTTAWKQKQFTIVGHKTEYGSLSEAECNTSLCACSLLPPTGKQVQAQLFWGTMTSNNYWSHPEIHDHHCFLWNQSKLTRTTKDTRMQH